MKLIVVEAPGKVHTIAQYLGSSYQVLATYGHIRNLLSKSGSVRPEEDFALTWVSLAKADKAIATIMQALQKADTLILATDLDREGEAISWHLLEYLREKKVLRPDLTIQRVTFNAITKQAILHALDHPREVDLHLVDAYLARLSLDYLVGFTLSPVLWRKLPGSRSAGRVQSVALRLVVERERDVSRFQVQEYWSLQGLFGETFPLSAQLTHFRKEKLDKLVIRDQFQAQEWALAVQTMPYRVRDVQKKKVQRHPMAPFITSTLQQEASRKLGLSPAKTMQLAQRLYEGVEIRGQTLGLITYMRTDCPVIIPEIIQDLRIFIEKSWGHPYVAPIVRQYKSKARSQEAHEAIRPTNISLTPAELQQEVSGELWGLYKLIWDRAVASQMASAQYDQTTIIVESIDEQYTFRTAGSVMTFDGFLILYEESQEEEVSQDSVKLLPLMAIGQELSLTKVLPEQHFTQPPSRYSEASLVKSLEELGIGRPSTYARILQVLQEREYVTLDKKRMIPKDLGILVTAFLCRFFSQYVDYHFTANLENELDQVSHGKKSWKTLLHAFWPPFFQTVQQSQSLPMAEVLSFIQQDIMEEKHCPRCHKGALSLRLGKVGPFLTCTRYPECTYSGNLSGTEEEAAPAVLGLHPATQKEVLLKKGPYGWYLQHEEERASVVAPFTPESITLEQALWLLSLPKTIGTHPETGKVMAVGIGRFGPYLRYDQRFYSIKGKNLEAIGVDQALEIIQKAPPTRKKREKSSSTKKEPPLP